MSVQPAEAAQPKSDRRSSQFTSTTAAGRRSAAVPGHPVVLPQAAVLVSDDGAPIVRRRGLRAPLLRGRDRGDRAAAAGSVSPREHVGYRLVRLRTTSGSTISAGPTAARTCSRRGRTASRRSGPARAGVGPRLDDLAVRTYVNGALVQEGHTSELLFPFAQLVADLSRFMTLEPGDVILTGHAGRLAAARAGRRRRGRSVRRGTHPNEVVADDRPLEPIGAMPKRHAGRTRAGARDVAARPQ